MTTIQTRLQHLAQEMWRENVPEPLTIELYDIIADLAYRLRIADSRVVEVRAAIEGIGRQ